MNGSMRLLQVGCHSSFGSSEGGAFARGDKGGIFECVSCLWVSENDTQMTWIVLTLARNDASTAVMGQDLANKMDAGIRFGPASMAKPIGQLSGQVSSDVLIPLLVGTIVANVIVRSSLRVCQPKSTSTMAADPLDLHSFFVEYRPKCRLKV